MKQPIDVPRAQAAYQRTSLAYAGAAGRFRILDLSPDRPVADQYLELLGCPRRDRAALLDDACLDDTPRVGEERPGLEQCQRA